MVEQLRNTVPGARASRCRSRFPAAAARRFCAGTDAVRLGLAATRGVPRESQPGDACRRDRLEFIATSLPAFATRSAFRLDRRAHSSLRARHDPPQPAGRGTAQPHRARGRYCDQAHFNRDFTSFAGTTPTALLAVASPKAAAERLTRRIGTESRWVTRPATIRRGSWSPPDGAIMRFIRSLKLTLLALVLLALVVTLRTPSRSHASWRRLHSFTADTDVAVEPEPLYVEKGTSTPTGPLRRIRSRLHPGAAADQGRYWSVENGPLCSTASAAPASPSTCTARSRRPINSSQLTDRRPRSNPSNTLWRRALSRCTSFMDEKS